MKNLLIFLFFFCVGILVVFLSKAGLDLLQEQKEKNALQIPTAFSLAKAPSATIYGSITSLSGTVGWESRIATEPARIKVAQKVGQGEALETKEDGRVTVLFPNVGTITLLPKTYVGIIQTLPSQVVLAQTKGNVIYKKSGTIPLSINSNSLLIKINNGQISLNINDTLPLITGDTAAGASATLAYVDINNQSNVIIVENGQGFTFNTRTKKLRVGP